MTAPDDLSLGEWVVLGLVAEGRTHGFAVSRELARSGSVGRIWSIPRPLVYRAIASLVSRSLVEEVGPAPGLAGPQRRLVEVGTEGRAALGRWLEAPIDHVRDARAELLVKLLLLERSGRDRAPLLAAQAARLEPILAGLQDQLAASGGFDSTLARWRLYSAEALARFVEELLAERPH